jgi:hypothetical protein
LDVAEKPTGAPTTPGPSVDARLEVEIRAPSLVDLPCGVYRVKTPSRWPFHPSTEGWHRRHFGAQQQFSH